MATRNMHGKVSLQQWSTSEEQSKQRKVRATHIYTQFSHKITESDHWGHNTAHFATNRVKTYVRNSLKRP